MKIDITGLLIIFDNLMDCTKEEQGEYWFETIRADSTRIVLHVSLESNKVYISAEYLKVPIADLTIYNCVEVRVLDEKLKQCEILDKNGRCFVDLVSGTSFDYVTPNQ